MGISIEELQRRAQEAAAAAEYGLNWSSPGYDPDLVVGHVERFSKVWDRYPRIVLCVYEGDLAAAARDTDEQVVARVCEWGNAGRLQRFGWNPMLIDFISKSIQAP